jgi:hypothetical protein
MSVAYEMHPNLITPAAGTVLWRYLDCAKFMDILERRVLWFARADTFEDPLEGTYTDAELLQLRSLPSIPTPEGPDHVGDAYLRGSKMIRSTSFISCWRAGADESMAMWDRYRIAIKSTVGHFKEAVSGYGKSVYIGEVRYVDWKDSPWDNNLLAMCVRKVFAYKHESEVRALIWDTENLSRVSSTIPLGLEVPFDPRKSITEVWVGPREKPWMYALVTEVMKRYGLAQEVIASTLLQPRI